MKFGFGREIEAFLGVAVEVVKFRVIVAVYENRCGAGPVGGGRTLVRCNGVLPENLVDFGRLGLAAVAVHMAIDDKPIARLQTAQ